MATPPTVIGELPSPAPRAAMKARFLGVDVTRGVALIAMVAANVWDVIGADGKPTVAGMTVEGRAATLFAMVAGISLGFITGGRHPYQGRRRRAARANIAVRALMIGLIGLALGYISTVTVILPYYGLFFLLAIPLVGLRPRALVAIAAVLVVAGPLILLGASHLRWGPAFDQLTLTSPFTQPIGFVSQLLVTGYFPAVTYMVYVCAGMAIARLDLSSTTVAARCLVGGGALAIVVWFTSWLIVLHLGGLRHLIAAGAGATRAQVVWDGDSVPSWWWFTLDVHHSGTPFDLLQTLGCALAVLGAVLLVTRLPAARRVLWPVGVAGTMTLTIYCAHAPFASSNLLSANPFTRFWIIVAAALALAVLWRHWLGLGPLERLVALPADRARATVLAGPTRERTDGARPREQRGGAELGPAQEGASP